jgi:hydroxymethylpyrimidine pyrophosphatase-like HAD family hydrolase
MTFCDFSGIDKQIIRNIYRGEYYSTYQFYRANKFYDEMLADSLYYSACNHAADTVEMNDALIADIQSNSSDFATVAITAGILDIWEHIKKKINFLNIAIGKGRANDGGIYVSTLVKQAIVEELRLLGKRTIAIGDSPVDIGMLEAADYGYLIAMQKLSMGVVEYLVENPQTGICQLAYSPYKYDCIKEVNSIWPL